MKWFSPSEFHWEDAPLNKFSQAATTVSVYIAAVFMIEHIIHKTGGLNQRVLKYVKYWQAVHNLFLSLGSLGMVIMACYLAVRSKLGHFPDDPDTGTEFLVCTTSQPPSSGHMFYWVYIFYLSKYVELLDTIIQMLKGTRPPSFFFHMWHHTVYLLICWGYNQYRSSLGYLAIIINGTVHVIMYYYYYTISKISILKDKAVAAAAVAANTTILASNKSETMTQSVGGVCDEKLLAQATQMAKASAAKVPTVPQVWWKHYITQVQIIQFVAGYGFFSLYAKRRYWDGNNCNGEGVLIVHAFFNLTMLTGFIKIFTRIRRGGKKSPASKVKPATKEAGI